MFSLNDVIIRGLYPFELVDSGIDWLGKIPSHWRIVPFSTLDNDPKYLEFLLRSERFVKQFGKRSPDDQSLENVLIPRPPLFEQAEIADFLDNHSQSER